MVLIITCSLGATTALAAESNDNTGQNETIVIDGSVYEFEEAYWNGMPATYINNLTENTRDVVYYDDCEKDVRFHVPQRAQHRIAHHGLLAQNEHYEIKDGE